MTRTPSHVKRSRGPWAIASFIAIPLFFSSLMASTLALEKPRVVQWHDGDRLLTTWHDPAPVTEAKIWLWALLPPLVLIVIGWIAIRVPYGWYVSCVSAIVIAFGVLHRINIWTLHHTLRFPWGVDLIPGTTTSPGSNTFDAGEWERMARETAISLGHWTMGIAIAAIVVVATAGARRRYFARGPAVTFIPLEGVHGVDATMPGLSTREEVELADSDLARHDRPGRWRNR